jgi:hypothetical protein
VDRAPKAFFAVVDPHGALVEHGKRLHDAGIATLTGRHAFPISSSVENTRKLGPVASGVATAAL